MALLARKLWVEILLLFLLAGVPVHSFAADVLQLHEQQIKAGLLYNFLKYTEWPASHPSMVVCVFGEDPFEGYLQPMEGRSVNQMEITLRFIHTVHEMDTCNLLFVNAGERKQWPTLQKALAEKNVLTVSDFEGFAASGGMIEFGKKNEHIDVDLNIDAVNATHLHVRDRLLKLVTVVHPSPI